MNLSERNNLKFEHLISSPIYKIYNKRKMTQDDQTTVASEHSIRNKKKILPNKSIPILKIQRSLNSLLSKINENNSKSKTNINTNANNDLLPGITSIDSYETIKFNEKNKSRNIQLSLNSFNSNNFKSTDNNYNKSKLNIYQSQIQKLLKRHKINPEKDPKKLPLNTHFLIKDTDIVRKKYYFGFINNEKNNDTINNYNNNNQRNQVSFEKLIIKSSSSVPKMKIKPLLNKKGKIKFDIDKLLKKRFKSPIERNSSNNQIIKKKIKLKPLNFKKINHTKKEKFHLDKVLSEGNIFNRLKTNPLLKNINLSKYNNLKSINKENGQKKIIKDNEKKLTFGTHSILKHDLKNKSLENHSKTVKFKEKSSKKLSPYFDKINGKELLNDKRKTLKLDKRKNSGKKNTFENTTFNNLLLLDDEDFSPEYEDSNFSDSEEERKMKKNLKEKKKFRIRTSSTTLNLSKQLVKSYEFVNISPKDKKFLIKLYPNNLLIKKILATNYSHILNESSNYIANKIRRKEKNNIKQFNYSEGLFLSNINANDNKLFIDIELSKIQKMSYYQYINNGLGNVIAFHLMKKYLPISPQIIEKIISGKTYDKLKNEETGFDLNFNFSSLYKYESRKTIMDIKDLKIYEIMLQTKDNLIFYQKFIYWDYLDIIPKFNDELISFDSFNDDKSELGKKKNQKKRKRKRINLDLLRKKYFFQMEGIKRKEISSTFEKYIKNQNDVIKLLVKKIEFLKNKNKKDSQLGPLCYRLFDYLIRNQSNNLVLRFHHRYHNLFDINITDPCNHNDTLLIIATRENSINLIKYFLEKGADPNITNDYGNTAMHYAISYKYFDIVDILRKNGAREDIENLRGLIPWECVNGEGE